MAVGNDDGRSVKCKSQTSFTLPNFLWGGVTCQSVVPPSDFLFCSWPLILISFWTLTQWSLKSSKRTVGTERRESVITVRDWFHQFTTTLSDSGSSSSGWQRPVVLVLCVIMLHRLTFPLNSATICQHYSHYEKEWKSRKQNTMEKKLKSDAVSSSKAQLAKSRWADTWKIILYAEKFDINFYVMLMKHCNIVS